MRDDPESFYNGALARDIISDLKEINGTVTDSDLRDYRPIPREPYQRGLSGMKMYLTPPPTSGAVLGLILNILRGRSSRLVLVSYYYYSHDYSHHYYILISNSPSQKHCDQFSTCSTYSSPSLCAHSSSRSKNQSD